ncbi:MAG: helix-turn-helix domain-containing protein [Acidimicrobiales bacterium]
MSRSGPTLTGSAANENGHITPSVDALVRLAGALDVSLDYLVKEGAPRRNLDGHELGDLGNRLADFSELSDEDRASLLNVLDGLLAKSRLKALVGGISQRPLPNNALALGVRPVW